MLIVSISSLSYVIIDWNILRGSWTATANRPPVPAVRPRPYLVQFWPNYTKLLKHTQNPKNKPYPTFLILGLVFFVVGFFLFFLFFLGYFWENSGIILMSPGFYFCNLIVLTLS